jgi:integrase
MAMTAAKATKKRITDAQIEALAKRAAKASAGLFLWDADQPGFGVRASPKGKRAQKVSFIAQRYMLGEQERTTIGHWPSMSIDEAREEAGRRIRDKLTPLADAKAKEHEAIKEAHAAITVSSAVERYLVEAPLEKTKKPRAAYWHQAGQTLSRELVKGLGEQTKLRNITVENVRKLIKAKQLAEQPSAARYLYSAMSAFFNWCVGEGLLEKSPLDGYGNKPKPGEGRDRILTDAELKTFWKATEGDDLWNRYFRLLLLTAQRREEVAGIERSELDLAKGLWTIPKEKTKNGVPHIVHLSPQAIAEIQRCTSSEGTGYLFPATPMVDRYGNKLPLKKGTVSGYAKPKRRLDTAMGIETDETKKGFDPSKLWRVHDLRRTARSGFARLRVPREVAEKILNHITGNSKLDKIYDRFEYLDERKAALEAWGNLVQRIAFELQDEKSNIVSFQRA